MKRFVFGALALLPVLVACEARSPADSGVVVDTLPSGVPTVRGPSNGVWASEGAWSLVERTRLGSADTQGPELFGNVWDIEVDELGRIYVLDRLAKEVRVFSGAGQFLRVMGSEGEGPGEFSNPFGLAWSPAGNLWVVDVRLSRYSVFDTTGAHVREYRREVGGYSWPWPGRFTADGSLLEASFMSDEDAIVASSVGEALTPTGSFTKALAQQLPGDFWDLRDEQRIGSVVPIPFGRTSIWALTHDRHLWLGDSGAYSIAKRSLSGDTLFVIERDATEFSVSEAERDLKIADLDRFLDHPKLDLSRIPATKPFFSALLPDDSGRLWVLREGLGDDWFFDVFAADGAFLGSVVLPLVPSLYPPPLVRPPYVVAVTQDDLGIPYVVLFDVVAP